MASNMQKDSSKTNFTKDDEDSASKNKQSWRILSVIQCASIPALPIVFFSDSLQKSVGIFDFIIALILGVILFWIVCSSVVLLGSAEKLNTTQIFERHFGGLGKYSISLILLFCLSIWSAIEITEHSKAILNVINTYGRMTLGTEEIMVCQVFLLLLGFLFCLLGINGLARIGLICLIYIVFFIVLTISFYHEAPDLPVRSFSFPGFRIAFCSVISMLMVVPIDLPNFFKYSITKKDSLIGLGIFAVSIVLIEIAGIFLLNKINKIREIVPEEIIQTNGVIALLLTVFLVLVCAFVVAINIFSASVAIETFYPGFTYKKRIQVTGFFTLLTTVVYFFYREVILNLSDYFDSMLILISITLCVIFLRPNFFSVKTNFAAWLLGCITIGCLHFKMFKLDIEPLIAGLIVLFICLIIFYFMFYSFSSIKGKKPDLL